jgi:tRNA modification GTPase
VFSPTDTIVAIATPPGRGGVGVVRVSGPRAREIARQILTVGRDLAPRHATRTHALGPDGRPADEVVATLFAAPHSYTVEDVVEISGHGSPALLRGIVAGAVAAGARLAEPGEFTLRAFLNGRIDLVQAEAVADLVAAVTPLQARVAFDQLEGTLTRAIGALDDELFDLAARLEASLDFPDEGYHFVARDEAGAVLRRVRAGIDTLLATARLGRVIREGRQVAIVGKPNVGKSSLFNWLVGTDRAIVTDRPGTTRDLVTETIDFEGVRLGLVDTAGLRPPEDAVEHEGISRARAAAGVAELVLAVFDRSRPFDDEDRAVLEHTAAARRIVVLNKTDLARAAGAGLPGADLPFAGPASTTVTISLKTGTGLDDLRRALRAALDAGDDAPRDAPLVTNLRHETLLRRAAASLDRALDGVETRGEESHEELVLDDIAAARDAFGEVTGRRATDDVLRHIFEGFCIGK